MQRSQSLPPMRRDYGWDGGGIGEPASRRDGVVSGNGVHEGSGPTAGPMGLGEAPLEPSGEEQRPPSLHKHDEAGIIGTAPLSPSLGVQKESSSKEPGQTVQTRLPRILRIIEEAEELLRMRTQTLHQHSTLLSSLDFLETTAERLVTLAEGIASQTTNSAPQDRDELFAVAEKETAVDPASTVSLESPAALAREITLLAPILRRDLQRSREQQQHFRSDYERINNREYRLNEKQKVMADDLKDAEKAALMISQIATEVQTQVNTPKSLRPASEIPSMVGLYFDKRGDIGVWNERRDELMEELAEGAAERAFIADRGDPLEVTDDDFNKQFELRLEHIDRELKVAEEEANLLEERCRENGLDIERYRTTRRSETDSSTSENPGESLFQKSHAILEAAIGLQKSPRPPAQSTGRVGAWLRSVPLDAMSPLDEIPPLDDIPSSALQTPHSMDEEIEQLDLQHFTEPAVPSMFIPIEESLQKPFFDETPNDTNQYTTAFPATAPQSIHSEAGEAQEPAPSPSPKATVKTPLVAIEEPFREASFEGSPESTDQLTTILLTTGLRPVHPRTPRPSTHSPLSVDEPSPRQSLGSAVTHDTTPPGSAGDMATEEGIAPAVPVEAGICEPADHG